MEPTIGFNPPKRNPSTSGTVNQYMKRNFNMFGSGGATNPNAAKLDALRRQRSKFQGGGKEWQAIQDQIMGIRNQRNIDKVAPKPTPQNQPRPITPQPVQQQTPPPVQMKPPQPQPQPQPQTQPKPQPQPQSYPPVQSGTPAVNHDTRPVNVGPTPPETGAEGTGTGSSWDWDFDWGKSSNGSNGHWGEFNNGSNGQDYPQWGGGYSQGEYDQYDPYGWESGGYGGYDDYGQDPYYGGGYNDPYGGGYGQYDDYGQYDEYDMYGGGYDPYEDMYGGGYGQFDMYDDMSGSGYENEQNYPTNQGQDPQTSPPNDTMESGNTGTTGNGTGQPDAIPADQMPKPYWLQQIESNGRFSPWHDFAGQAPFATKSQWAGMDPTEQQGYLGMIPKYLQNDYLENMQKAWIPGVQRSRAFLQ